MNEWMGDTQRGSEVDRKAGWRARRQMDKVCVRWTSPGHCYYNSVV